MKETNSTVDMAIAVKVLWLVRLGSEVENS